MVNDGFSKLKFMAYCLSQLPPDDVPSDFSDFVDYAKFQLCLKNHKLMKDPIWDSYTNEAIIVEYFAHLFHNSEKHRIDFERELNNTREDIDDWLVKQTTKKPELEDKISFNPESLGD